MGAGYSHMNDLTVLQTTQVLQRDISMNRYNDSYVDDDV